MTNQRSLMNPPIIDEIMSLRNQPLEALKTRYSELFPGQVLSSNNKVFIWRRIAHKLQEQAYGPLSDASQGRIQTLIAQYDPVNNKALRKSGSAPSGFARTCASSATCNMCSGAR